MSIFTPPTDSFYKFLAIGGLVVFTSVLFTTFNGVDKAWELNLIQSGEEKVLQKEIDTFLDELEYNNKYQKLDSNWIEFVSQLKDSSTVLDSSMKIKIYNLPDSIQSRFNTFFIKVEELKAKRELINNNESTNDSYFIPYLIAIYSGEIFAILGFAFWYSNLQKPKDEELQQNRLKKLIHGEIWYGKCQSCLKTIYSENDLGTEKNGSLNKLYCNSCYNHGNFCTPKLTLTEAKEKLELQLSELGYNKFRIWRNKRYLKKLERWKRLKVW